jgi:hypothetical protein
MDTFLATKKAGETSRGHTCQLFVPDKGFVYIVPMNPACVSTSGMIDDWCSFREQKQKFPFNREVLGRVLGPAKGEGNEMPQWILKANGKVIPRRSLRERQRYGW